MSNSQINITFFQHLSKENITLDVTGRVVVEENLSKIISEHQEKNLPCKDLEQNLCGVGCNDNCGSTSNEIEENKTSSPSVK
ncbi:MAG: hypothetical protein A2X78_01940 [Gammaproteobacteria bacterium GWE2_37_16]|nr:MAG: hypothetical protein A2X78_01940 [Gammaproteobacteria bacterium GWE2_37_16]